MENEVDLMESKVAFRTHDDVINLIINGDWEDVLLTLTEDMDPWDVDLVRLNERFTESILKMNEKDLRIPGKILLAAAIIYRFKVETLKQEQEEKIESFDELPLTPVERETVNIPPITVPLKRQTKRKVSIDELVYALKKAMVIKKRRESRKFFKIEISKEDITENIEELYGKIINFLERNNMITFSRLLKGARDRGEKLRRFHSLLHLLNQERITCDQEEIFGEIYISKL